MNKLIQILLLVGLVAALLTYAGTRADEARTTRIYAQAALVTAQSNARTDTLTALMPYTVIVVVGVMAVVALTLATGAFVLVSRQAIAAPAIRIVERQVVVIEATARRNGADRAKIRYLIGDSHER